MWLVNPQMRGGVKISHIKVHCCQLSLVQESYWKGDFNSKINSNNQKIDIFTKGLQGGLFVSIRKLVCGW